MFMFDTKTNYANRLWLSTHGRLMSDSDDRFDITGFDPKVFIEKNLDASNVNIVYQHSESKQRESSWTDRYTFERVSFTALHCAVALGDTALINHLLSLGADINAAQKQESHLTVKNINGMNQRTADLDQDIDTKQETYQTALDLALAKEDQAVIKLLVDRDAKTYQDLQSSSAPAISNN